MATNLILDRLEGVKLRFEEVGQLLTQPDIINDMKRYVKLNREYKELEPIVTSYKEYKNLLSNIDNAKQILSTEKDEEMRLMAKEEIDQLLERVEPLEDKIKILLLPADPEDNKNDP